MNWTEQSTKLDDLLKPRESGYAKFLRSLRESVDKPAAGAGHEEELRRCAADTTYWVDAYCQTYDPRTPGKSMPFKLWPRQVEFLGWLKSLKEEAARIPEGRQQAQITALCVKSRDVGVSFLCAADALHDWLFIPGYKVGFGSRKLQYVDNLGDKDSIFEKIRFMLRHLPAWMLPAGFKFGKHDSYTKIINPASGAAITGEGGDEIGRGGRTGIYFLDEAARVERPNLVDQALIATTGLRVDVSTPNGPGNPFAVKRFSLPPERVFEFHWRSDPRKDEAWAEQTKREKGLVFFASEYDLDFSASVEGICIPGAWVRAAVGLKEKLEARGVAWPDFGCVAGLDIGEEGQDLSVFIARKGSEVLMPVAWQGALTTETAWRARDEAVTAQARQLYYDVVGIGAGVKGTWRTSEKVLPFLERPVNVGASPSESYWPDGQTSQEKFFNFKAELWWCLRRRFEKTFEYVTLGLTHYPLDELISLPDCPQLIADLSLPLVEYTETGKIRIESKASLAKRGIKSPDYAEALVLSEAHYAVRLKEAWVR